jgi:glucose-1-phosphate thymidylyltransferase
MKAIILAAGYATRLYPLTENMPKPLLPIDDKPILEYILKDVSDITAIDEIIIVTNHKFFKYFEEWEAGFECKDPISLVNDGTLTNESRLGAIRDIQLTIERMSIQEDILILAGDNIYDFSLHGFVESFLQRQHDSVMVHKENNLAKLCKTGVAEISYDNQVISFEEKPSVPKSCYAVPPFYIYKKDTLPLFLQYLNEGNNPDAPGNFIAWLCKKHTVYAYLMEGHRYDIGDIASYEEAKRAWKDLPRGR